MIAEYESADKSFEDFTAGSALIDDIFERMEIRDGLDDDTKLIMPKEMLDIFPDEMDFIVVDNTIRDLVTASLALLEMVDKLKEKGVL
jgi:hypothetical protein